MDMSRENIFALMKLFYLIMILYIMNIPTTQERKNKQPHRKMGKKVTGNLWKRKRNWPTNTREGIRPIKYLIKIILNAIFLPTDWQRGKRQKRKSVARVLETCTLNYYLQGYTFMQLLWRAIWKFLSKFKMFTDCWDQPRCWEAPSPGKAPQPKRMESHCGVTMSKHQKQLKCLLWGTHCEH